jgi:hypothetical protein
LAWIRGSGVSTSRVSLFCTDGSRGGVLTIQLSPVLPRTSTSTRP